MTKQRRKNDAPSTPQPTTVLYEYVDNRRYELRLTLDEVADAAGVHASTILNLRDPTKNPRKLTLRGVETALGWEPRSIDAILAGGEPTVIAQATKPPPEQIRGTIADIRTMLADIEARLGEIEDQL